MYFTVTIDLRNRSDVFERFSTLADSFRVLRTRLKLVIIATALCQNRSHHEERPTRSLSCEFATSTDVCKSPLAEAISREGNNWIESAIYYKCHRISISFTTLWEFILLINVLEFRLNTVYTTSNFIFLYKERDWMSEKLVDRIGRV